MRKAYSKKIFPAFVALAAFAFLAAFSPLLHNHPLDNDTPDQHCAPCHWSQANISMDAPPTSPTFFTTVDFVPAENAPPFHPLQPYSLLNRSPPLVAPSL